MTEWPNCPKCGKPCEIAHGREWEVRCDRCHVAEYGETLEQAVRCIENPTEEQR